MRILIIIAWDSSFANKDANVRVSGGLILNHPLSPATRRARATIAPLLVTSQASPNDSLVTRRGSLSSLNPAKIECLRCPSGIHSVNSI